MPIRFSLRVCLAAVSAVAVSACSHNSPEPAAAPQPAAAAVSALPAGVTTAMIAAGDSIFHKGSCQRCHGMDAKGTARAPDLTDGTWSQISGTYPEIVHIITVGVPKAQIKMAGAPFGMNPKGGTNMSDDDIAKVAAYVYSLSHK